MNHETSFIISDVANNQPLQDENGYVFDGIKIDVWNYNLYSNLKISILLFWLNR